MTDLWISPFWQALTLPPSMRVCGVKVAPLSVWHVYALENIGCALTNGGAVEAGDVVQLLMVASRTRAQFLQMFADPRWIDKAQRKIKTAMLRHAYRGGGDAITQAIAYAETCMRIPHRWRKDDSSKQPAVPHSLHVLRGAVKCGVPYADAWDMPYATARVLFDAQAEASGDQSIMDDTDQRIDERMAAENRKEVANG